MAALMKLTIHCIRFKTHQLHHLVRLIVDNCAQCLRWTPNITGDFLSFRWWLSACPDESGQGYTNTDDRMHTPPQIFQYHTCSRGCAGDCPYRHMCPYRRGWTAKHMVHLMTVWAGKLGTQEHLLGGMVAARLLQHFWNETGPVIIYIRCGFMHPSSHPAKSCHNICIKEWIYH